MPRFPQAGECERLAIGTADMMRLPLLRIPGPFIVTIGRNETAALFHCCPKRRLGRGVFAAGVDHLVTDFGVVRPGRHESPAHLGKLATGIGLANHCHVLRRGDVVPQRQLQLAVQSEMLNKHVGRRPKRESPAHNLTLPWPANVVTGQIMRFRK